MALTFILNLRAFKAPAWSQSAREARRLSPRFYSDAENRFAQSHLDHRDFLREAVVQLEYAEAFCDRDR
jgi:hypothetical protein